MVKCLKQTCHCYTDRFWRNTYMNTTPNIIFLDLYFIIYSLYFKKSVTLAKNNLFQN